VLRGDWEGVVGLGGERGGSVVGVGGLWGWVTRGGVWWVFFVFFFFLFFFYVFCFFFVGGVCWVGGCFLFVFFRVVGWGG